MSHPILFKIVIIGDSAVGKTSIVNAATEHKFTQTHKVTIGADLLHKQLQLDGKMVKLEVWDTAGQERFRCMGAAFYRGVNCCVIVYDITDRKSFENVESWLEGFIDQGQPQNIDTFPFLLLGNKSDCADKRSVDEIAVREFLAKHPTFKHMQVSAKNNNGVEEAFKMMGQLALENWSPEIIKPYVDTSKLIKPNRKKNSKRVCCP